MILNAVEWFLKVSGCCWMILHVFADLHCHSCLRKPAFGPLNWVSGNNNHCYQCVLIAINHLFITMIGLWMLHSSAFNGHIDEERQCPSPPTLKRILNSASSLQSYAEFGHGKLPCSFAGSIESPSENNCFVWSLGSVSSFLRKPSIRLVMRFILLPHHSGWGC